MYERTEVVAEFITEAEAQVALARLRLDGICVAITGHVPCATSFSLLGRLPFAPIQLAVAVSQADRARFILAAAGVEVLEPEWEDLAETAVDGWICRMCDTEVPACEHACPECGTPWSHLGIQEDE
jgi:rubrerythrin